MASETQETPMAASSPQSNPLPAQNAEMMMDFIGKMFSDLRESGSESPDAINGETSSNTSEGSEEFAECASTTNRRSACKLDKHTEEILKALRCLQSPEEKLAALCNKYVELVKENRKLNLKLKSTLNKNKQLATDSEKLQKEKDDLSVDLDKHQALNKTLQDLCRELQKQNSQLRDETKSTIQVYKKEFQAKFDAAVDVVNTDMAQKDESNRILKEHNDELWKKLKNLIEKFETQEQRIKEAQVNMEKEKELLETKVQQMTSLIQLMKEHHGNETEKLNNQVEILTAQNDGYKSREDEYKTQVLTYQEKFEEFQETVTKSNDMFGTFKAEMDKLREKTNKMETERKMWKGKLETANNSLTTMTTKNKALLSDLKNEKLKTTQLTTLSRALQKERNDLHMMVSKKGKKNGRTSPHTLLDKAAAEVIGTGESNPGSDDVTMQQ